MPGPLDTTKKSNRLLASLSPADYGLIDADLSVVDLPLRRELEAPRRSIEHVYFIDSGFASVVANGPGGISIEVGLIGREGVTGLPVIMGTDRSPNRTFMQGAGSGRRLSAAQLRSAMRHSETLHDALLNYAHVFVTQTSQTAMANGYGKIEQRLARWLCMAHDRSDGDELRLTHEFLAVMLCVRRPGVTVALDRLVDARLVMTSRGRIAIINRPGLEQLATGIYGAPELEFRRLFS